MWVLTSVIAVLLSHLPQEWMYDSGLPEMRLAWKNVNTGCPSIGGLLSGVTTRVLSARLVVDDRGSGSDVPMMVPGASGGWQPRNLIRLRSVEWVCLTKPGVFRVNLILKLWVDGLPDLLYLCCRI